MRLVATLILLAATRAEARAASLLVEVRDVRGAPVPDAVVYAVPEAKKLPPPSHAVLDQKNRTFVPHVLPIQTGTAVTFPNSDNVRHQVYSFSSAKRFQLPLYAGTPAAPVVFDKAGVVTIGCNIHDQMSAYLVVVDTPFFAPTASGRAELSNLPEGKYDVHVWYAGMRKEPPSEPVRLGADEQKSVSFHIGNK